MPKGIAKLNSYLLKRQASLISQYKKCTLCLTSHALEGFVDPCKSGLLEVDVSEDPRENLVLLDYEIAEIALVFRR